MIILVYPARGIYGLIILLGLLGSASGSLLSSLFTRSYGTHEAKTAASNIVQTTPVKFRVITHNVRGTPVTLTTNEQPWSVRKTYLMNELRFNLWNNPEGFYCGQEVSQTQLPDMIAGFNVNGDSWTHIGPTEASLTGRLRLFDYNPLFYRSTAWNLTASDIMWLNPDNTPGVVGWDAAHVRAVTIGTFQHKATGKQVIGMCTHLDETGSVARLESTKLIVQRALNMSQQDVKAPVFLAGDFNGNQNYPSYQYLTVQPGYWTDTATKVPLPGWYGHHNTTTGFTGGALGYIDFIFLRGDGWSVRNFAILNSVYDDGIYNSDHRAVAVDLQLG